MLANILAFFLVLFSLSTIALIIRFIKQKARKKPNIKTRKLLLLSAGLFVAAFIALWIILPTAESPVEARVSRVIDGDTLELESGERVRLIGINTPERGEPGADEATQFVRDLVEGQTVWLESSGNDRDRHNRLRRYVWVQEPTDTQNENEIQEKQLNAMLLSSGLAVAFNVLGGQTDSQPEAERAPAPSESRYIGNSNSETFHLANCSSLPAPHNRVYFDTRNEAVEAGFRPCGRCNP